MAFRTTFRDSRNSRQNLLDGLAVDERRPAGLGDRLHSQHPNLGSQHRTGTTVDPIGPGQTLLADAACDGNRLRDHLKSVSAKAAIRLIPRRSAPPPLDRDSYRRRNRIERFSSKLKHYRAIATRYEKHDANVLALIKLAAARIWLRVSRCPSVP